MKTWLRFEMISKTNATPQNCIHVIVNLHFNRMLRKCFWARLTGFPKKHGPPNQEFWLHKCFKLFVAKGFFDFKFCIHVWCPHVYESVQKRYKWFHILAKYGSVYILNKLTSTRIILDRCTCMCYMN